jgi:hypothetical protein
MNPASPSGFAGTSCRGRDAHAPDWLALFSFSQLSTINSQLLP